MTYNETNTFRDYKQNVPRHGNIKHKNTNTQTHTHTHSTHTHTHTQKIYIYDQQNSNNPLYTCVPILLYVVTSLLISIINSYNLYVRFIHRELQVWKENNTVRPHVVKC